MANTGSIWSQLHTLVKSLDSILLGCNAITPTKSVHTHTHTHTHEDRWKYHILPWWQQTRTRKAHAADAAPAGEDFLISQFNCSHAQVAQQKQPPIFICSVTFSKRSALQYSRRSKHLLISKSFIMFKVWCLVKRGLLFCARMSQTSKRRHLNTW